MSEDAHGDAVQQPGEQDDRFWSVTTIIKASQGNEGLVYWSADETAKAAVRSARTLAQRIEDEGPFEVQRWLREARFRRPPGERSASELGTAIHDACEQYALTGVRPEVDDELRPYLDHFDRWVQKHSPEFLATELTVYSDDYGYAGTLDFIARVHGVVVIGDYKTSKKSKDSRGKAKKPYPEVALQLAAYRYAEHALPVKPRRFERGGRRYYLLGPDERPQLVPMPEVQGALALSITPEHCNAHPVNTSPAVFDHFGYCIERARWAFDVSRTVLGDAIA